MTAQATAATTAPPVTPTTPDQVDATLARIHDDLADDGVAIDPSLAPTVTSEQLARTAAHVEESSTPLYVVVHPLDDGDAFSGDAADLLARLHAAYPASGTYVSTTTSLADSEYGDIRLEARSYDVPGVTDGDFYGDALFAVNAEAQPTVGAAIERATELLVAPPAEATAAYEAARSQRCSQEPDACSDEESGGSGLDPSGLVVVLVVVLVLGGLAWAGIRAWGARAAGGLPRRGRSARGRSLPAARPDEPFVLPASAMDRVRAAHDRRLEQSARTELLALGEAVDGTEIGPRHDQAAWQAAIDHYDAARTTLARTEDRDRDDDRRGPAVLDVVGALVLARRGHDALRSALRGRPWAPMTGCFLNPLHGEARTEHPVTTATGDDVRRAVPVCAACRSDLAAGRHPDVLDVVHRGEPRHYFETGVEPWAATGYGSLDPDLVTALRRTRR